MAGDSGDVTDHDFKFGIPMRSTSRGKGIIEAGQPFDSKLGKGIEKNPLK